MLTPTNSPVFPSPFRSYIPPHEKVYGAICISPENKVLVVRGRSSGKWSFPKGHLKPRSNERAFECALRELYEETGIFIDTKTVNSCSVPSKRFRVGEYFILDLEREIAPLPRDVREISEARWVTQDELQGFLTDDIANIDIRSFVNKMLSPPSTPRV
jgi:8-oxo-dGTP pyrophosphatase MutT (NUDIX family)